jgi:hypothetical protein
MDVAIDVANVTIDVVISQGLRQVLPPNFAMMFEVMQKVTHVFWTHALPLGLPCC